MIFILNTSDILQAGLMNISWKQEVVTKEKATYSFPLSKQTRGQENN